MSESLSEFIDEHGLTIEDVIDALDLDPSVFDEVPEAPTDFYDGEPNPEDLSEDFDAVELLLDEKESLEQQVADLQADLEEARRPIFEDKAEQLAELTEKWGDKQRLLERFEDDEDEVFETVDDVEAKIELVEDIKGEDTTTVDSDGGSGSSKPDPTDEFDTTPQGKIDLRSRTKIATE